MTTRPTLALALTFCAACSVPAFAQSGHAEEIQAIRAEMKRLADRLDKLEAENSAQQPGIPLIAAQPQPALMQPPEPAASAKYEIPEILTRNPQLALSPSDITALSSRTIAGATLDRALLPDGNAFELGATSDASSVAIKLARSWSEEPGETIGAYTTLALTASAPLANGSRFSDIGTLDGFIGGSKLRFQFSRYERRISEPDLHPAFDALVQTAKSACLARLGADAKECAPSFFSSQFVREYAPELETPLLAMARMTSGATPRVDWSARSYGAEFSIGYKKFEFLETGPARKSETSHIPLSGKLFFSYLPDVRRNSITGAVEYQRTFKDAPAGALCPAVAHGIEFQCLTGPIGDPRSAKKLLLSGEYRHKLVFGESSFIPTIGISLLGTYDALNDEFGLDVPVYLVNDPKNGLTGGIRFGYTTSEKDFIAGIFVGTAFGLK